MESKAYKDMDLKELKMERLRLVRILGSHPKPITYKQTKKALNRINDLMAQKVADTLRG